MNYLNFTCWVSWYLEKHYDLNNKYASKISIRHFLKPPRSILKSVMLPTKWGRQTEFREIITRLYGNRVFLLKQCCYIIEVDFFSKKTFKISRRLFRKKSGLQFELFDWTVRRIIQRFQYDHAIIRQSNTSFRDND